MSLFGTGRREGLLAVLILLLLSVALHAPGLFLGQPRGPAPEALWSMHAQEQFTNTDTLVPTMHAAGEVVRGGELPLWNTLSRLGEPFLTSGAPVFYPPFWLLMLPGGSNLLDLLLCLHTFVAGMCMYRFCRAFGLSRYVGFQAGALYGLGWFMTAQLDRLPDAAAAALLPLALEFTWRVTTQARRSIYAGWLSVVVTTMLATGGLGTATLGLALCAALFIRGVCALDRDNQRAAWRSATISMGFACLLTAPMWIHYLVHARYMAVSAEVPTPGLQIGGLLGVLSPIAFGGLAQTTPDSLRMVNPGADALELVLFPGSVVLFLAVLGLMWPKRTTLGLFWIVVGGIGLLLSIDGPIAAAAGRLAPGILGNPGTSLLLVHVAFVVLAAVSLESFFEAPVARPIAVHISVGVTFAVALAVLLLGFAFPGAGAALLAPLTNGTAAELSQAVEHLRFALLPTVLFATVIALLFAIWKRIGLLRFKLALQVTVVAELLSVALVHTPRGDHEHPASRLSARIPESTGRAILVGRDAPVSSAPLLEAGVATLTTTSPGILARTRDLLCTIDPSLVLLDHKARVLPLQAGSLLADELLDTAGVGIAVTAEPGSFPGFETLALPLAPAPAPAVESRGVARAHFHLRTAPPRRARLHFAAIPASQRDDARDLLVNHTAQLTNAVVVEGAPAEFTCKVPTRKTHVEVRTQGANTLRARVDMADGRGYLVFADAHAPGWKAWVDGKPQRVLPANVGLRAIALTEGEHEVTMIYSPWMCRLGLPIAIFGLLMLLGWLTCARSLTRR